MLSEFADAWATIEGMVHGVTAALLSLSMVLLVLRLCYVAGKAVKALIIRATRQRRHRNLSVVLGYLAQ